MVSLLSLSRTQWTRKPWSFVTPVFQPARRADWKVGVTSMRSMESFLFLSDLLTAHESELRKPLEINKTIFRFMRRLPLLTLAVGFSISIPCKSPVRGTPFSSCS